MIEVQFADIFTQDVDAIVNPANEEMRHGGGLAAEIARRGGNVLVRQSAELAPIETGEAIHTLPGELPFKGVIHTVGPRWGDVEPEQSDELLRAAHLNALRLAGAYEYTSVALPAVSCGVFRFPVWRAAPIAVTATRKALTEHPIERVIFCVLDEDHYDAFSEAIDTKET